MRRRSEHLNVPVAQAARVVMAEIQRVWLWKILSELVAGESQVGRRFSWRFTWRGDEEHTKRQPVVGEGEQTTLLRGKQTGDGEGIWNYVATVEVVRVA